jgi:hypothetical protein
MQFLLLIYEAESLMSTRSDAENGAVLQEYMAFTADIRATGKLVAGDALKPTPTATTVRVRDGKTVVTDGPFAETKEQLGGYYLVEATDLDDALKIAARVPGARYGCVEVRPIWSFG